MQTQELQDKLVEETGPVGRNMDLWEGFRNIHARKENNKNNSVLLWR